MYNFLVLVLLQLIFQAMDYFWSFIAGLFNDSSKWKDCPKDLEFWHSVHGILASVTLTIVMVTFRRTQLNIATIRFLLKSAVILQVFSLYWLLLGFMWIVNVLSDNPGCMPESAFEVILTYLGGVGLWLLESILIIKCLESINFNLAIDQNSAEIISKLEENELNSEAICSICLDALPRGVLLPSCQHSFHKPCILRWAEFNPTCPFCRSTIS